MEWYTVGIGLFCLLMVLISIGLPIPFALAAASLPFLWTIQDFETSLVSSELKLWGVWVDYILLAVPLFVLLGELIARSNIGPNLYLFMHKGVRIRGSAAYGSIGACAGFGAVCGSSMVGALTIGGVALPEMLKLGYGKRLSAGVLAAGGTLSVLIPPSLILLFYGIVTDKSIGELFIAGAVPGLILVTLFVIVVLIWTRLYPNDVPTAEGGDKLPIGLILSAVLPVALIGFVITAAIYTGVATPTEAAAMSAVYAFVIAVFVYKDLTIRDVPRVLLGSASMSAMILYIITNAVLFSFLMTSEQIPQQLTAWMLDKGVNWITFLIFVNILLLVAGNVMEASSIVLITAPILFPIAVKLGIHPVHLGILMVVNMEVGMCHPPVGLNLYVASGIAKMGITELTIAVWPWLLTMLGFLVVVTFVPEISLWLPRTLGMLR